MRIRFSILSAAAPAALLLALTVGHARADDDWSKGRKHDAVEMCRDYAQNLLRDRDRNSNVEIGDINRVDEDNDRVKVDGYLRSSDNRDQRAEMRCEVNFKGDNKVASFNDDDFVRDWRDRGGRDRDRDYSDRDRDRDRNGRNVADDARQACRRAAEREGYDVRNVINDEETSKDWTKVRLNLRKHGDDFYATCAYNQDRNDASLARVDKRG